MPQDFDTDGELQNVEDRLRAERHQATPLELDTIKSHVLTRATRRTPRRAGMRQRIIATLAAGALTLGTTGSVIAGGGKGGSGGHSGGHGQYGCKKGKGHGKHKGKHGSGKGSCKPPKGSHGSNGGSNGGSHGSNGGSSSD